MSWTTENAIKLLEVLIDRDYPLHTHKDFRKGMDRDQNLYVNQVVRSANTNVAYSSVNFDINGMDDAMFWSKIDASKHSEFVEEDVASRILKMAERFNLVN